MLSPINVGVTKVIAAPGVGANLVRIRFIGENFTRCLKHCVSAKCGHLETT